MKVSKPSSNPNASTTDPSPPLHTGRDSVSQRSPMAADCQAPEAVRGGAEARRFPFPSLPSISLSGRRGHGRRGGGGGGGGSGRAAVAAMGGPGGLRQARRLCHWGPLVALAVVAVCSATAMADAALWYWPLDTAGGSVNFVVLLNWTVMILYNYFSAMFVGPGYVPLGWTPVRAASLREWGWGGEGKKGVVGEGWGSPMSRLCRRNWSFRVPCTLMQVLGWCRLCCWRYGLHSVN